MSRRNNLDYIPVIDLFAGPGGLNEGFSHTIRGRIRFHSVLSIEKEIPEHNTLSLRAFYRYFLYRGQRVPQEYYQYIQGLNEITRETLWKQYPEAAGAADKEALLATLGQEDGPHGFSFLEGKINAALGADKNWLLIGGPPCQAYSLVGRSKRLGQYKKEEKSLKAAEDRFYKDERHRLYQQYLRILAIHVPAVFVMENVQGILSAKLDGKPIFPQILQDLKNPNESIRQYGWSTQKKHQYHIVSFVTGKEPEILSDFLIKSDEYGIPQARHRVILLGIRDDIWDNIGGNVSCLQLVKRKNTVRDVIGNLPPLRSGLSKHTDSLGEWQNFISKVEQESFFHALPNEVQNKIRQYNEIRQKKEFLKSSTEAYTSPNALDFWYKDERLSKNLNHEARAHMPSDLYRYLFVSILGEINHQSPQLNDFPAELLPKHKNVINRAPDEAQKFADRFKVQVWDQPSSTVTSHISKDGHYFIHPDPLQCRSLSVREAARLQTFPDNYFFEGNRTQQFHQVGNAVPPYLAFLLSKVVFKIFEDAHLVKK